MNVYLNNLRVLTSSLVQVLNIHCFLTYCTVSEHDFFFYSLGDEFGHRCSRSWPSIAVILSLQVHGGSQGKNWIGSYVQSQEKRGLTVRQSLQKNISWTLALNSRAGTLSLYDYIEVKTNDWVEFEFWLKFFCEPFCN